MMEKQAYIETVGSSRYLVTRAAKPLNAVERRFMKTRGFLAEDSRRRVFRCYVGSNEAELRSLVVTLCRFGYVMTVPAAVVATDCVPLEDHYKRLDAVAASMSAYMNHRAGVVASITCQLSELSAAEKVAPNMADEETARYTRLVGNWKAY